MGMQSFIAPCIGDVTPSPFGNGLVNIDDLLTVIGHWGPCPAPCPPTCVGDVDGNCVVNIDDLLLVIGHWGACP